MLGKLELIFLYYGCSERISVMFLQCQRERTVITLHKTLISINAYWIETVCFSLLQSPHNVNPSPPNVVCLCECVSVCERERDYVYLYACEG
jgi:hypothetical protein